MARNDAQTFTVSPLDVTFDDGVVLDSGRTFAPISVRYETYGRLDNRRSNAILIVHAFSGDAHAAGYHPGARHPGWWDTMIGPGKAFDTDKYFVICSNVLGGCQGTTGPGSIDPATGKPYALAFPVITINDMVKVQKRLLDYLGIDRLLTVAGGSMGGMQALDWAVSYPQSVATAVILASTARLSAQGIAFDAVGRNAIMSDPRWNNGDYYHEIALRRNRRVPRRLRNTLATEVCFVLRGTRLAAGSSAVGETSPDQASVSRS